MKKFISIVLTLVLMASAIPVFAAQTVKNVNIVSLGDSIAFGAGVKNNEAYPAVLAEKLKSEENYTVSFTNLSQNGDATKDLLAKIADPAYAAELKKADIITISIGGNNYLGTLTSSLTGGLEDITNLQAFVSGQNAELLATMPEIAAFISNYGKYESLNDAFYGILSILAKNLNSVDVQTKFAQGLSEFRTDFPKIISEIKTLSPNAKIYVMTIYNPLDKDNPAYSIIENLNLQLNAMIAAQKDILPVDVYAAYDAFTPKTALSLGGLDPHPTVLGHKLIANEHYKAITGKASKETITYTPPTYSDKELTRGEAVNILVTELVTKIGVFSDWEADSDVKLFTDVADNAYAASIAAARALGLISGDGQKFNPNAPLTRQDFACIVANFDKLALTIGVKSMFPPMLTMIYYLDEETAAPYARQNLIKCVQANVFSTNNKTLDPLGGVTESDIMKLLGK